MEPFFPPLSVLFRSCSRIHSVHGGRRLLGLEKPQVIAGCLGSLIRSLEHAAQNFRQAPLSLTVLDDHSDEASVSNIRAQLAACSFVTNFLPLSATGNGASIRANYEQARAGGPGLIYFVEDDYLHVPAAISEMIQVYPFLAERFKRDVALTSCDYPDRYDMIYPSYIAAGAHRYWRSVQHTTGTFLISHAVLDKYWENFIAFANYDIDIKCTEDTTINRVWREVPCFSPMPSLALHFQTEKTLSPFVDWKAWWAANQSPAPASHP